MPDNWQQAVEEAIAGATGKDFATQSKSSCGGGCINDAYLLHGHDQSYFVKLNDASAEAMFAAEYRALETIVDADAIRAPRPMARGRHGGRAFLVLEAITFGSAPSGDWSAMGEQLAALHRKVNDRFGWPEGNFIGSSPQCNAWADDWATFYREQRLRPQFEMAKRRGSPIRGAENLLKAVGDLLAGHTPEPSLLHGDLWGGNAGHDADGAPVIYDPASYYGDRETDLAFTEMFGGFPSSFYSAYDRAWPRANGYEQRKALYNLYHVVNHANLFGGGYHSQAESVIRQLLAS